jgi:radical SAM superfamily enzyme YgiQ (UPF0313 family)
MKPKDFFKNETLLFDRQSGGELHVLNCFPNTYEVGMASLAYQTIFRLYASHPQTHAFRYFTNAQEFFPKELDLITFSISWELDFFNIFDILQKLQIPILASERDASHPVILAGGPVVTANPAPWAKYFDLIAIGDSEANTNLIIEKCIQFRRNDLAAYIDIPGIYVPSAKQEFIERAKSSNKEMQVSSVIAPDSVWQDTGLVEVVRSCPEMCRFCLASYLALPFRTPDLEGDLIPKTKMLLEHTKNIGLLGASVTQHPEFIDLLKFLVDQQAKIQVSSMRASTVTREMCELLVKGNSKNITIAIESGSQRLRDIINKKLPEEYIFSAAKAASEAGIKQIKLYGMVGLPHETDEDIEATKDLLMRLKNNNKTLKIIWGCSIFTPKAQTPFQDYGVDAKASDKLKNLIRALKPHGIEVRDESYSWAEVQALISRGDSSVGEIMLKAYQMKNTGANIYRKLMSPEDYRYFVFENWEEKIEYPWHMLLSDAQKRVLESHKQDALIKQQ